jgi:DinB superfamily
MHVVLERAVHQISSEIRDLDAETTQLHPKGLAYKWSAQEVVEHLVLSYRFTTEGLEARLNKGQPLRNRTRTRLQWSLQLMILSFGALPRGVPALDETMPTPGSFAAMNGRQLEDLLRQEIGAMDAVLDRCRRKFGMDRVSTHPWLGPLRVDQWRRFHVVHGLHHVAQLRSVIETVAPSPAPVRITRENLVEKLQIPAQRPLA